MQDNMFEEDGSLNVSYSLYSVLEVQPPCTEDELLKAYRRQALKYHPDKTAGCAERFKQIKDAYELLKDPIKRKFYDRFGDKGVTNILANDSGLNVLADTSTWIGRFILKVLTRPVRLIPIFFFFAFVGLSIVLFFNFIDRKLYYSGFKNTPWWALFLPFWFAHLFLVSLFALYLFVFVKSFKNIVKFTMDSDEFSRLQAPRRRFISFVSVSENVFSVTSWIFVSLCSIYCEVILTLNLDPTGSISTGKSWYNIFWPLLMLLLGTSFINILLTCILMFRISNPKRLGRERVLFLVNGVYMSVHYFGFFYLLLKWLDSSERLHLGLFKAFSWFYLGILLQTLRSFITNEWKMQDLENNLILEADSSLHFAIRRSLSSRAKWTRISYLIVAGVALSVTYLPHAHLLGRWPYSWSATFFPILVVVYFLMFVFGLGFPCIVTCMDMIIPLNSFDKFHSGEERVTIIEIASIYPFGYGLAPIQPRICNIR